MRRALTSCLLLALCIFQLSPFFLLLALLSISFGLLIIFFFPPLIHTALCAPPFLGFTLVLLCLFRFPSVLPDNLLFLLQPLSPSATPPFNSILRWWIICFSSFFPFLAPSFLSYSLRSLPKFIDKVFCPFPQQPLPYPLVFHIPVSCSLNQ